MLSTILKLTAVQAATSVELTEPQNFFLLDLHNEERAVYGVPLLIWDDQIARKASQYGNMVLIVSTLIVARILGSQATP